MPRRRRAALLVVVGSITIGSITVGAIGAASPAGAADDSEACSLVTRQELRRTFGIAFDAEASDDTACFWTSSARDPLATIIVGLDDTLSAKAIAMGKKTERTAPGAVTFRGIGDLTVYQTSTSATGETGFTLYVFDGDTVGLINGSVDGELPPETTMRKLARTFQRRL